MKKSTKWYSYLLAFGMGFFITWILYILLRHLLP